MSTEANQEEQPVEQPRPIFGQEIELFTKHIDAIGHVLLGLVFAIQSATNEAKKRLVAYEDENCTVVDKGDEREVAVPHTKFRDWESMRRQYEHFALSRSLLPRSLLVSLVSQYDAYLGRLLREIFVKEPGILKASERTITFESLNHFQSIEAAREYILEKEIESILRSSHASQFDWMESKFSMKLRKGLDRWPLFVEITERRNLFVHTDGKASSQYIAVCKKHKYDLEDSVTEGARLGVPQAYFEAAHDCIYEIGVKLGHVLWRKHFAHESDEADTSLNDLCYELISKERYKLASILLDFACTTLKRHSNAASQLTFAINRAQARRWDDDPEGCVEILNAIDWSDKEDRFKLARAVLTEDWKGAANLMTALGPNGKVSEAYYRDWPLFKEFRKRKEFLEAFEEIFGEAFDKKSELKSESLSSDSGEDSLPEDTVEAIP